MLIGRLFAVDNHPQFATGGDGERLLHPFEAVRNRLQLFHPLDVAFQRFSPGAGSAGTAGISRCDQHRVGVIGDDFVMMPERGMDNFGRFVTSTQQVGADLGVSPLQFMIGGLADIVQQPTASGQVGIHPQHFGEQAADEGDFDAVSQHILAVGSTKMESTEHFNDAVVQPRDVHFVGSFPSFLEDERTDLFGRLFHDLFDFGRVNTAIGDQSVERLPGDFSADRIEAADDHDTGCIVDDHVHAGGFFEGPDVPPFAADDATLDVIGGDVDGAGGRLRRMC